MLVVGDSLTVGDGSYIKDYLGGTKVTINAEIGDSSPEIYKRFEDSFDPSQSVVVFDAGTNDSPASPQILAAQLDAVAGQIGNRCMVVPTVNGPTVNGVDSSGINRAIYSFAASRPGTQVPDWAGAVSRAPDAAQPRRHPPDPRGRGLPGAAHRRRRPRLQRRLSGRGSRCAI